MTVEITAVNACKDLLLRSISDSGGNELTLTVAAAVPFGPIHDIEILGGTINDVQDIEHRHGDPIFKIYWESYIAYSVLNESYTGSDDGDEIESAGLIGTYSKSAFLDYVSKATFASHDYPGPFRHWCVTCMDHIINVVSTDSPLISLVDQP